jgi:hypothetical protein
MSLREVQQVFGDSRTRAKAVRWTVPVFVMSALVAFNLRQSNISWPVVVAWSFAGTAALLAVRANLVAKWILDPSTQRITPVHIGLWGLVLGSWFVLYFVVLR